MIEWLQKIKIKANRHEPSNEVQALSYVLYMVLVTIRVLFVVAIFFCAYSTMLDDISFTWC